MESKSPFVLTKQLETQLNSALSMIDVYDLPAKEAKLVHALKQEVLDARLDARDYELSETRAEQIKCAQVAKKRLEQVRKNILAASEYNVFGAVDVAQLSAQIEQIIDYIQ